MHASEFGYCIPLYGSVQENERNRHQGILASIKFSETDKQQEGRQTTPWFGNCCQDKAAVHERWPATCTTWPNNVHFHANESCVKLHNQFFRPALTLLVIADDVKTTSWPFSQGTASGSESQSVMYHQELSTCILSVIDFPWIHCNRDVCHNVIRMYCSSFPSCKKALKTFSFRDSFQF